MKLYNISIYEVYIVISSRNISWYLEFNSHFHEMGYRTRTVKGIVSGNTDGATSFFKEPSKEKYKVNGMDISLTSLDCNCRL